MRSHSRRSRLQALETALQSLEVAPVMAVLGEAPSHDAAQLLGLDNLGHLFGDELGRVPRPVDLGRGVPVPLAAPFRVGLAVGHGVEERAAAIVLRLKRDGARQARVAAVGVLEDGRRAAGGLVAGRAVLCGEPLGVKGEAEVHLAGGHAAREVSLDGGEGALDRRVVVGDGVAAVHEVVRHDIDKVDGGGNLGHLRGGKGNHVALLAGHGNGELLVADGGLDLIEQQRVRLNLGDLARVGVLLVVLAVAAGILPVDVCAVSVMLCMPGGWNMVSVPTQS